MATFPYAPDWGCKPTMTPRVLKAQFGDGYDQRVSDGINTRLPVWPLTFSVRTQTEAQAIASWLATNNADTTSFDWTAPDGTVGKWIANKWSPATPDEYNSWSVTAEFRQVPM